MKWCQQPPDLDVFFMVDSCVLLQEWLWASKRPATSWTDHDDDDNYIDTMTIINEIDTFASGASSRSSIFYDVLTDTEQRFLKGHTASYPGQVYSLNQNPDVTPTRSTRPMLHTIIKNAGILWWLDYVSLISDVGCLNL